MWRGGEVESVEEWEKFRDIIMECNNDVCGMRRVGGQRRKRSEWWNEEVSRAMAEKEELLRNAFREEIGLPMTDTEHRECCETGSPSGKKNGRPATGKAIGE